MNGLWLEDRRLRYRDDIDAPAVAAGEAVVRVLAAGICNTDLEMVKGYYPFTGVPGHEFVGRVESAPSAPEREGRRVVGEINASCGDLRGLPGEAPHPLRAPHRARDQRPQRGFR